MSLYQKGRPWAAFLIPSIRRLVKITIPEHYLISKIVYDTMPFGVRTSIVSLFLWPRKALPSGDSLEMSPSAGLDSDTPTMVKVRLPSLDSTTTWQPTPITPTALVPCEMTTAFSRIL